MFALFVRTPDAAKLMEPDRRPATWWEQIRRHAGPAHILASK
jgi:hypothetical protein